MAISIADQITKQEAIVVAAQAKLADLLKLAGAAALIDKIAAGWSVSFKVGRAETRREVTGVVRGRGLVKDVDSVRVEVGEGFDLEVFTIKVAELTGITEPAAEPASELAVVLGTTAAGVSEADALLNDLVG